MKWLKKIGENGEQYGPWTLCLDLEDCYGTINTQLIARILRDHLDVDPDNFLPLLSLLDKFNTGLVQGYLISDLLAAVILTAIDRYVQRHDLVMARYSDDCFFACESKEGCEILAKGHVSS